MRCGWSWVRWASLVLFVALVQVPALAGDASAPHASVQPLLAEPETRWSFGPFTFEAEPVVADGRVFVTGRDGTGRRALVVLDGASGRLLSRTLFPATLPLVLAAAGERVAVRTAPTRVDLFRVRGSRLLSERSFTSAGTFSRPHLEDDELVLREGDELVRYDLRRRDPTWRQGVPGAFHGAPVVRGEHVFAGWYDASGAAHLAWLERASGRVLGDALLGRHRDGRTPEERDLLQLVAHETCVFVAPAGGLPSTAGPDFAWTRVPFDGQRLGSPTLHDLLAPPLETADGWVAPERTQAGARWILVRRALQQGDGRERAVELAAPGHHAWLSACSAPASRAGDVLYLGPCAADGRSLQVLWRRAKGPALRPVPVDSGLLVVEDGVLSCLGGEPPAPEPERERVLERVATLESALGERLARIATQALRTGEGELAARLAAEAAELGANARTLALVEAEAQRSKDTQRDARADARRGALLAEEQAARDELPRALAEAAHGTLAPRERLALLDELFRRAPEHAAGLGELRRSLPTGTHVAPGEARAWLEFLRVAALQPIELVDTSLEDRLPTPEQRRLDAERSAWRRDAVGYASERLLVISAAAAPDAVAHTLRAGELVCEVLEQTFGGARAAAERLELVLYPTREEYLAHSGSDLGGLETVLGFTAGHYDLAAEVSRLFLPEGDEDGARLLSVSAHELTHHWLATRSRFGPPRAAPTARGFWIVEAIATWAEELRLDPLRGTWASAPARAASLDTLVNAGAKDLLPWRVLLSASYDDYTRLETRTTCTLALDWQLGAQAPRSPMQLFYAQGGALAHFLYEADGGARRALLLRAVEAYYRGQPLDVAAELGLTPEDLGERVVAWARGLRAR